MERLHFITNICHKKAPMQKVRGFLHNLHRFWHPDTVFGDGFQHDRSSSARSCALSPSPVSYIIAKGESHNQDSPFPVAKSAKAGSAYAPPADQIGSCYSEAAAVLRLCRRRALPTSIPQTSSTKPRKIALTSLHAYWFIAKMSGAPMPPAPTSPRTDASRMLTSNRYSTAEESAGASCGSTA